MLHDGLLQPRTVPPTNSRTLSIAPHFLLTAKYIELASKPADVHVQHLVESLNEVRDREVEDVAQSTWRPSK